MLNVIFALIDYLRYRFQKGPYSLRKLERDGWFVGDKSSLDVLKAANDGDILCCQPLNSPASWIVMYFQGGPCSHVAMLTKQGNVIEAIASGVVERPASVYFDGKHYLTIRHHQQWTEEMGRALVSSMRKLIGCRYGWGKLVSLGFHILIGNTSDWRPRIGIDAFILLATVWLAAYKIPSIRWVVLAIGALYAATLFMVRLRPHPAPYETTVTGRWPQRPL
jgi:hypothetical protein